MRWAKPFKMHNAYFNGSDYTFGSFLLSHPNNFKVSELDSTCYVVSGIYSARSWISGIWTVDALGIHNYKRPYHGNKGDVNREDGSFDIALARYGYVMRCPEELSL